MTTLADDPDVAGTPNTGSPARAHRLARAFGVVSAYVALTKPRIIELLLVTTVPTMILAERGMPPLPLVLATLAGGTLSAGSANALNCWWDHDIDLLMRRTEKRPLVTNAVTARGALVFGLTLGGLSVLLLGVSTNWLTAGLALTAIAFYVLVYTMWLKRRTSQNIVWGGAAGCMPVLIGWAAVTGSLAAEPVVLFAVIFLWTPPHYWPLAIRYSDDYAAAGVPMLPVVATPRTVAIRIASYAWAMVAVSLLLVWPLHASGVLYAIVAVGAGAVFLREAHLLLAREKAGVELAPMRLFHWSISYLALLFLAVAVDQFL